MYCNGAEIALFAVLCVAFGIAAIWTIGKIIVSIIDRIMERYEKWCERTNHMTMSECSYDGRKRRGMWNRTYI